MCKQKHFKCIFSSASLFAYAIKQSYHFIWKQIFSSIRFWFMIVILTPVQMVKFVCKISLRNSDTQITSAFDSWILLPSCSWRCKHCLFNRIVWFLYLRFYKKFQYLKRSKHHHFFLGTINFLRHQAPLSLFIDLINPHSIILSIQKINMLRLFYLLISQKVHEL